MRNDQAIFRAEDLSINFGGLKALDSLDLLLFEGETLGLIGPNGSGKSTFFNLITGIYRPTKGGFFFKGEDLTGMPPYRIARRGLARTFQTVRLCLELSVLDNVIIGFHRYQKAGVLGSILNRSRFAREAAGTAREVAELLGIFSRELPRRLFTPVKELPQIDRRRVEICRALASRATLLLLDEPSAGMNPEETVELMDDIRKFRARHPEISVVIIEHDLTVIRTISDRVLALNYGKKIIEGTYEEVSRDQEVREAYLGRED